VQADTNTRATHASRDFVTLYLLLLVLTMEVIGGFSDVTQM
jgi:hypothetical protein